MDLTEKITGIAKVCHETNRAYCSTIGDNSQLPWEDAPEWQRQSVINGVRFKLENPGVFPEDQHDAWARDKIKDGWKYGHVKDAEKKEHPCLVPYNELPRGQKIKDYLFTHIVDILS